MTEELPKPGFPMVAALAFALAAALCSPSRASEFMAVAAGCVPDPDNIRGNDYLVTAGTVKHQTGKLRDIRLRCPVSIEITKPARIYLVASSDDGGVLNQKTFVSARLSAKSNFDDGRNDYCSVSTEQASQDGAVHLIDVPCKPAPLAWDQNRYAWYLDITIHRRSTSHIAVFYGAGLY